MTRSETSRAKPISWVTTIIVVPSARELAHDAENFVGQLRIERRGRLVEQHHLGLHRERARDRDALLLAAGQARRILARLVCEVNAGEAFGAELGGLLARQAAHAHRRLDHVAEHGHVRPQVELLKDHAEVAPHPVDLRQRPRLAAARRIPRKHIDSPSMKISPEVGVSR